MFSDIPFNGEINKWMHGMRNRLVTSAETGSVVNYLLPQRRADGFRPGFDEVNEEDLREVTVDPNLQIVDEDAVNAEIAHQVAKKEAQHAEYLRIVNSMIECHQEDKERLIRVDHKRMKEQVCWNSSFQGADQIRHDSALSPPPSSSH